jgi:dTDP-4-amino-4,6-dideoxygalactose transaminase
MKDRINVTKTFMPPIREYEFYLEKIWKSSQLTNQGPLLLDFETEIKRKLNLKNFQIVSNGTVAIQLALKALGIDSGEVITTPFTYVATTGALLWEKLKPIFVDIDPKTLCIDPDKIESKINKNTKAILAVHVYGINCDVEKISKLSKKYDIPVIYDGAHSFGCKYDGQSLFNFGDVSTCSFHSTKLFHTIEGGGIFCNDKKLYKKIDLLKRFGHNFDDYISEGINAKASEFQAAMGLCNLKYIDNIVNDRKYISEKYDSLLTDKVARPYRSNKLAYNYSYYPIILKSEEILLKILKQLEIINIFPRRYFYPSLNKLKYLKTSNPCPISEDISSRVLCLPLYSGLPISVVEKISDVINEITETEK